MYAKRLGGTIKVLLSLSLVLLDVAYRLVNTHADKKIKDDTHPPLPARGLQ
jgi:hypothetical protein